MAIEQTAIEQMTIEQMTIEQMTIEQMTIEQMAIEQMAIEQMAIEQWAALGSHRSKDKGSKTRVQGPISLLELRPKAERRLQNALLRSRSLPWRPTGDPPAYY